MLHFSPGSSSRHIFDMLVFTPATFFDAFEPVSGSLDVFRSDIDLRSTECDVDVKGVQVDRVADRRNPRFEQLVDQERRFQQVLRFVTERF